MRVLVTGAGGRVGSAATTALVEAGHEVTATDLVHSAGSAAPLTLADLTDHTTAYRLLEGQDAVVHLGNHPHAFALRPRQRVLTDNVTMNTNLFAAAGDLGVRRVIFASTVQVVVGLNIGDRYRYGSGEPPPRLPLDGTLPPNPSSNLYAMSKVFGEQTLAWLAGADPELAAASVRLPMMIKSFEHPSRRDHLRAISPKDRGRLNDGLSFCRMQDAGRLFAAMVERLTPGHRVVFPAQTFGIEGLSPDEAADLLLPDVPRTAPLDPLGGWVDCRELERDFGWVPAEPPPRIALAQD